MVLSIYRCIYDDPHHWLLVAEQVSLRTGLGKQLSLLSFLFGSQFDNLWSSQERKQHSSQGERREIYLDSDLWKSDLLGKFSPLFTTHPPTYPAGLQFTTFLHFLGYLDSYLGPIIGSGSFNKSTFSRSVHGLTGFMPLEPLSRRDFLDNIYPRMDIRLHLSLHPGVSELFIFIYNWDPHNFLSRLEDNPQHGSNLSALLHPHYEANTRDNPIQPDIGLQAQRKLWGRLLTFSGRVEINLYTQKVS